MKKIRAYILMVVLFIPLIYANNMEASTEKPTEQIKIIVNENGKDTTYYFEKNAEDVYEIETEERNDNYKKEADNNSSFDAETIILIFLVSLLLSILTFIVL